MKKTLVVYGSTTGTCESIAQTIASKLGAEAINVTDLTAEAIAGAGNLVLGSSTWGAGDLQDDWYDGLDLLKQADLKGKTLALFGCGDCESYCDTFCGAMGVIYDALKDSGARFVGAVSTDGYNFDDSEAAQNGEFVGLAIDDVNEGDRTESRIDEWVKAISPEL